MAEYTRASALQGEDIELRAVITDSAGNLINPDDEDEGPVVYIYDASIDSDTMEEEVEAGTYTSAIAGSFIATKLSDGYYSYTYSIPTGEEIGTWFDVWIAEVNGIENKEILRFTVEEEIKIDDQSIEKNTMIIVKLDNTISNLDGDEFLEETTLFYTTTYSPLYGSPDLVRMELGPWIDYISDNAIALMLHWSSREADFISSYPTEPVAKKSRIAFARAKFAVYDAALKLLSQTGGGQVAGFSSGGKKQLGDLMIQEGTLNVTANANTLDFLREQRNLWMAVVNSGSLLNPGESPMMVTGVKGIYNPDRINPGRLWESPVDEHYEIPTISERTSVYPSQTAKWRYRSSPTVKNRWYPW